MPERRSFGSWVRGWTAKAFRLGSAVVSDNGASLVSYGTGFGMEDPNMVPPEKFAELSVAVYACIRLRSQVLASVPLAVYRQTPEGKVPVTEGPLVDLLSFVNPHWTGQRLKHMTEASLCTWGEAFWVLERGTRGRDLPREIYWARSDRMKPIPDAEGYIKGFVYRDGNRELTFTPGEVIWFRYPNPADEFRGLSPLASARASVEASVEAMRSNALIFRNGMAPGGILSPADNATSFTKEERELLEAQLSRRLSGTDRRHRMMVFSHEVKIQTPMLSPKDVEFLGLMGWTLNDVCRVFQVPPSKVQDFSRATYSNAEQAEKAFWNDAILPELTMIASEITEQLCPMFGEDLSVEFDTSRIKALQEDQTEITSQIVQLAGLGVPLNKLLQVYRPELLPEGSSGYAWGDAPLQFALAGIGFGQEAKPAPAASAAPEEPTAPTEAKAFDGGTRSPFVPSRVPEFGSTRHKAELRSRDRLIAPLEDRMHRAFMEWASALEAELLGKLTKGSKAEGETGDLDPNDPFDRDEWAAMADEAMGPIIADSAALGGSINLRRIGAGLAFDIKAPDAVAFLLARRQRFARFVTEDRWNGLKASLAQGMDSGEDILELSGRVSRVIAPASSAETVARTEVVGAYNGGANQAFRQSGVVAEKAWLATLDDRLRPSHRALHGQVVPVDSEFIAPLPYDASGPHPGDMGSAGEDINCRCTVIGILGEPVGSNEAGDFVGVEAGRAEEEF